MFNSFNFIGKSQIKFFKEYGYLVLQNQLTYKIKHELKKYKGGTFNLGNEITSGLIVVAIVSITGSYILWHLSKPQK